MIAPQDLGKRQDISKKRIFEDKIDSIMNGYEDKYNRNILRLDGSNDDEFNICCCKISTALRGKIAFALKHDSVRAEGTDTALSLITSAQNESPLRVMQNCTIAKSAWENFPSRLAVNSLIHSVKVLNSLFNLKIRRKEKMCDQICKDGTKRSMLVEINGLVSKSMQVGILVNFLYSHLEYSYIIESMNTMEEDKASGNYEAMIFIQAQERIDCLSRAQRSFDPDVGPLATIDQSRYNLIQENQNSRARDSWFQVW